ncbi:MAG: ABC transporter permease [Balneolaceae bacterium]|nr:ABC transporter permease [Balneolaceae bacterium]
MNLKEAFLQAYDSLKANKLRSSLTLLALVVGVFAVIVSTTAVAVLDNFFQNTMSMMGGNAINITRTPSIQLGEIDESVRNRAYVTFEDSEELEERLRLAGDVSPEEFFTGIAVISYGDRETDPTMQVVGSNENYLNNNAYELEFGRNFTREEIQNRRKVVLLGSEIRDELFPVEGAVDKSVRVEGQEFRVIGVLESKGSVMGSSMDGLVIIPYTTGIAMYGGNRNINIQVKAPSMDLIPDAIDEITGALRVIRKVGAGEPNSFEIETNDSLAGTFDQFTAILYIIGFVIGGITLFGAGIGVMNIMLVSVTERTREIGIRKAVGATRSAIVSQFLLEAVFICQIGGIIGMAVGILAGNGMALWIETEPVVPLWAVSMGFFGMLLIGVVFGVYPAYKASRLDPIESLRYE